MIRCTSQLFKSILITSPMTKAEVISKRISELFKLKLIHSKELERTNHTCMDIAPIVIKELDKNSCRSWLLHGFPRDRYDAELLWKEQPCHIALNLKLPIDALVSQANKQRFIHPSTGRIYTKQFNPPIHEGKDDVTGEELENYKDFSNKELKLIYTEKEQTLGPVLDFYREKKVLQEIHGHSIADLINKSRICLSSILPDFIM